jgi:uncharacterized RDD family membrane protein YckC
VTPDPTSPTLVTPDAVPLDLETATVGSRAVAYLLDLLLLGTGYLLLGLATAILGGGGFVPGWAGIALLLLLVFALQFGYPIGFETLWRGRTPGKAAMGLRVVTLEGAPVGLRHAAVRMTVGLFELLMLLGLPAIITSLVSARGQRLGDLAAGTLVVRERRVAAALAVESFPPPAGYEHYTARLDVSGLGPQDYATVRDTLRRLPSLPDVATRTRIAEQVATPLATRVSPAPPAEASAETWLRCVAAALQARRQPVGAWGGGRPAPRPASGWSPGSPGRAGGQGDGGGQGAGGGVGEAGGSAGPRRGEHEPPVEPPVGGGPPSSSPRSPGGFAPPS